MGGQAGVTDRPSRLSPSPSAYPPRALDPQKEAQGRPLKRDWGSQMQECFKKKKKDGVKMIGVLSARKDTSSLKQK